MNPNVRKGMLDRLVSMCTRSSGFTKLCGEIKKMSKEGIYLSNTSTVYGFIAKNVNSRFVFECILEKPDVDSKNHFIVIDDVRFAYTISNADNVYHSYAPITVPSMNHEEIGDVMALLEHLGRLFVELDSYENTTSTSKCCFDSNYNLSTSNLTVGNRSCFEVSLTNAIRTVKFTIFDTV